MAEEMTMVDIMLGAKDRILDGWCQGHKAEDENGIYCGLDGDPNIYLEGWDQRARSWCLLGAIEGAQGSYYGAGYKFMMDFLQSKGYLGYMTFNDNPGRTREQVLGMLEDMIGHAKELGV